MKPGIKKEVIEIKLSVKATVGEVWHALTDKDELENWWGEGVTIEPKVGGVFREKWEDDEGKKQLASGKVTAVKKQKEISFTWSEKDWPKDAVTQCTFTIEADGPKTILHLLHAGWETLPEAKRAKIMKDFKVGWGYHFDELKEYLNF